MLSCPKQKDFLDKHSDSGSIFWVEQTKTRLIAFMDKPKVAQALSDLLKTKPENKVSFWHKKYLAIAKFLPLDTLEADITSLNL